MVVLFNLDLSDDLTDPSRPPNQDITITVRPSSAKSVVIMLVTPAVSIVASVGWMLYRWSARKNQLLADPKAADKRATAAERRALENTDNFAPRRMSNQWTDSVREEERPVRVDEVNETTVVPP